MRHWTATMMLFNDNKTLLTYHQKLHKWVPPGGHVEENELLHEAAIRETMEEVGIEAAIVEDSPCTFAYELAVSLPRPFLIQLENIPAHKDQPAHQHIDAIFVGHVVGDPTPRGCEEACWYTLDQLDTLEMFSETREAILKAAQVFAYV